MRAYVTMEVVVGDDRRLTEKVFEEWIRYQLGDLMEFTAYGPLSAADELIDHVQNVEVAFEPPV